MAKRRLAKGVTSNAATNVDARPIRLLDFGYLRGLRLCCYTAVAMPTHTEEGKTADRTHALVQLLRNRSYEEIRQRMYDNPPGSPWWSACKTELDIRNGEKMSTAASEMSRLSVKMSTSTEHLEKLTETLVDSINDLTELLRGAKDSGRRVELMSYVIVGVTVVQMFYVAFSVFGKK